MTEKADIRARALRLLARREHSRFELERKLTACDFTYEVIKTLLDELVKDDLLNEARFADSYVWQRAQKGCGPIRIRAELQGRGVDKDVIREALEAADVDWIKLAMRERHKRFGNRRTENFKALARQMRFLSYRGFSDEQIRRATGDEHEKQC